tara:strand:- start:78 stop:971 length:894 start_codon:yes stop_codon:yes gene_type:complete
MTRRILHLHDGYAFVVSDLQGNLADFERILQLYYGRRQSVDSVYLLICGDLIHSYGGYNDESLKMLDMVIELSKKDLNIFLLMGNHELAHVMHWNLKKGNFNFSENLEIKMAEERHKYGHFLQNLPFAAFTKGGLFFNHTGPSKALAMINSEVWDLFFKFNSPWKWYSELDFEKSFGITEDHAEFWNQALGRKTLDTAEGKILWEVFMNKNELNYGEEYPRIVENFVITINKLAVANIIISGHIEESDGFKIVHENHFRLCSSHGASSNKSKKYLYLPIKKKFRKADELMPYLNNLW